MEYTVFFDQVNRTNIQVKATDEEEARVKANRLYKRDFEIPSTHVEDGWISKSDGEDK